MTYGNLYRWGVTELAQASVEEATIDARLLLEKSCNTDRNYLLVYGNEEVDEEQKLSFQEMIETRKKRIPLQHILGTQEFMGLEFAVNEHVLIPRQDTEVLVGEVMKHLHDGFHILDMCTGSGCILLSLLRYSNGCKGVGVDISSKALEVAKENARNLELMPVFIESDLFDKIEGKYDLIVSNPPYIRSDVIPTLMEEVKIHEPMLALDGMEDGLYFYKKITEDSIKYLHTGGFLFYEIGYDQGEDVSNIMKENGYLDVTTMKDYAGLDRVVYGVLSCR